MFSMVKMVFWVILGGQFMRIYGIRSGRNNIARLIVRSYIYNNKKYNNNKTTNIYNNDSIEAFWFAIMLTLVLLMFFM